MNPGKLIEEVESFSGNRLNKKEDLKLIFDAADTGGKIKELEELAFTAKYIIGLQRVLKKGGGNPEITNLEKIKKDYSDNLTKALMQMKEITKNLPDEKKDELNNNYFILTHHSLENLTALLEDLEWTKMYFNSQKHQAKN